MKANLLSPDKDPMGAAITDYFHHQKAGKLRVFSSQFEEDEIPINQLFRSFNEMSEPVMAERGVRDVRQINLFDVGFLETFDTILMLMNGSGIIGKLENMPDFFLRMKQLLRPGGCILMDSSDLRYLFEDEDGSFLIDLAGDYYGEIDFRMQYKNIKGDRFDWLYVDFQTVSMLPSMALKQS